MPYFSCSTHPPEGCPACNPGSWTWSGSARDRGNEGTHTHTYTPQPVVCGRICVSSLWLFAARPQVCGLPLPAARRARPASSCLASDGAWGFEAAVSRFDINDTSNDEKGIALFSLAVICLWENELFAERVLRRAGFHGCIQF